MADSKSNPSKSSKDDLSVSNLPDKHAEGTESVKGGMACNTNTITCPPPPKGKCMLGTVDA